MLLTRAVPGIVPVDLLLTDVRFANLFTREIYAAALAGRDRRIPEVGTAAWRGAVS